VQRRDQELIKAKKDAELAITQSSETEATLKKRFQEQLNELTEQLERASKSKSKYVSLPDITTFCHHNIRLHFQAFQENIWALFVRVFYVSQYN